MKKLITAAIVILLVAVFAASVSAETVGTVVYAQKTDTVPNLEQIDESWGEPSIIINSKSPNTELYTWWNDGNKYLHSSNDNPDLWTLYVNSGKTILPEDYDVELYYRWDDKNLYFGLKTHDDHFAGWLWPWEGDGVQMWLEPMEKARADGFLYSGVNPHDTQNPESKMFDFAFTLDIDDYSVIKGKPGYTNAATEYECHINTDKEGELHCIITIPLIVTLSAFVW